ncbi:MAG: phosphoglucosamine mutase [Elusimicrobiota bacterium]|nr:phosphoglucosamine mutase [Elusimicrobiota bacterium]
MKLFGTDGIRGNSTLYPFDNKTLSIIGKAAAKILGAKNKKILIVSDTRQSAARIQKRLSAGILDEGGKVVLGGIMPTPSASFLLRSKKYKAAIVISASHNPYIDNGIKIFGQNGLKLKDETETKIETLIKKYEQENIKIPALTAPLKVDLSLLKKYENFIAKTFKGRLKATIVLDCANGAAYKCAPEIFRKLGAKVVALNIKPDGKNINLHCGALHPHSAAAAVKAQKAFCGFCFDGDADRLICIDENGEVKDGDFFLYSMAKHLKSKKKLRNNVLITTVMANIGLLKAAKKEKIKVIKTNVGDRYVLECINKEKATLGGEQSGHFIFRDILGTGDGILSAVQLLKASAGKPLSDFFSGLSKFPQILLNETVSQKIPIAKLSTASQVIKNYEDELKDDGRILVRYSGTENLLRVMVEGIDAARIKEIAQDIIKTIKEEINDKTRS